MACLPKMNLTSLGASSLFSKKKLKSHCSKAPLTSLAKLIDTLSRRLGPLLSDDGGEADSKNSVVSELAGTHFHKIDAMCSGRKRDFLDVERYMVKILSLRYPINALFQIAPNKRFQEWLSTPSTISLIWGLRCSSFGIQRYIV